MTKGAPTDPVDAWFKAWCLWYWYGRKWGRPQPVYVRDDPRAVSPAPATSEKYDEDTAQWYDPDDSGDGRDLRGGLLP